MHFPTLGNSGPVTRVHIGLPVTDLKRSLAFYRILFGQEPTKIRKGYARFEVADPPLNLSLHTEEGGNGQASHASHFGVQVRSSRAVSQRAAKLEQAGLAPKRENQVTCCYAVQDKVWVIDPDGAEWEVFAVTDDDAEQYKSSLSGVCCEDICCEEPAS